MHSSKYARSSFRFQFAYREPNATHSIPGRYEHTHVDRFHRNNKFFFQIFGNEREKKRLPSHIHTRVQCANVIK